MEKNENSHNTMRRLRTAYFIFAGVAIVCFVLYFVGIISPNDRYDWQKAEGGSYYADDVALYSTNQMASNDLSCREFVVDNSDSSVTLIAHVSTYDVEVHATPEAYAKYDKGRTSLVMVFQMTRIVLIAAIVVLLFAFLFLFYKNLRNGHAFPTKHFALLSIAGVLIMLSTLCGDYCTYIEHRLMADLLAGSDWTPHVEFVLHVSRIVIGLVVVFMAEILRAGSDIQKEQELTI